MLVGKGAGKKASVFHAMRGSGITFCDNEVHILESFEGDWDDVTCKYCQRRKPTRKPKMK